MERLSENTLEEMDDDHFFDAQERSGDIKTIHKLPIEENAMHVQDEELRHPDVVEVEAVNATEDATVIVHNKIERGDGQTGILPVEEDETVNKYVVRNADTGETFDIRNMDSVPEEFSFFPDNLDTVATKISVAKGHKKESKFMQFRKKSSLKEVPTDPSTIEVESHKKHGRQFKTVQVLQTIQKHQGPIWAMKFSHDGVFIATGGQDNILRIWQVMSNATTEPSVTRQNLVHTDPEKEYEGHTAPIIDVSWSRSSFILSSSMDKTVRLWHTSRTDCLQIFQHPDSVPAVDFHPKEDRCFLSGCFDNKVRIWDIPDGKVTAWAQTPEMITAASFNPSGTMAVAGLLNGQCTFYRTEQLSYYTQIECRNQRGAMKRGRKVTGIEFAPGGKRVLITTNDSRMRLFNVEDYARVCKYKGLVNDNLQIKGTFSQDGENIICGSESGEVYIWRTIPSNGTTMRRLHGNKTDRNDQFERFPGCGTANGIATVSVFAPASTYALARSSIGCPELDDLHKIASTHFIVVATYDGSIRIFENNT